MAQARLSTPTTRHDTHRASARAVLGAGTRVRGRVTGDGDLSIEGHVEGEVHLRGELSIEEGARVVSDIDAGALRVAGTLEGDVSVTGSITIVSGARVHGDLHGSSISVEEGAQLDGSLDSDFTLPGVLESAPSGRAARR
jgi:cytoskeletal protein CcmA (bactofilin family)